MDKIYKKKVFGVVYLDIANIFKSMSVTAIIKSARLNIIALFACSTKGENKIAKR